MNARTLLDYKLMMLDPVRMDAYRKATKMRCPGKVVCEIGAGLGPLSLMALQAGAKRVYAIEVDDEALALAEEILACGGFGPDRFVPIHGMSTDVELPEKVDLILSETLDSAGIGENTTRFMEDARLRFLKPDGGFLPEGLDCYAALASPANYARKVEQWTRDLAEMGLDYGPMLTQLRSLQHAFRVNLDELYSTWIRWQQIDFKRPETFEELSGIAAQAHRSGEITGFALAFDAKLAPGVHIRTFPSDRMTHWKQGFCAFPASPITAVKGDVVWLELAIQPCETRFVELEKRVVSGPADQVLAYIERRIAEDAASRPPEPMVLDLRVWQGPQERILPASENPSETPAPAARAQSGNHPPLGAK